jgi:hypothetical protein
MMRAEKSKALPTGERGEAAPAPGPAAA